MEYLNTILLIVMSVAAGVLAALAIMWKERAVNAGAAAHNFELLLSSRAHQQEPMEEERKLHHDTMQQAFDYINDNGPWGVHDVGMMELRNKLMSVLNKSSVGRV